MHIICFCNAILAYDRQGLSESSGMLVDYDAV
jgi:hypothetical protein